MSNQAIFHSQADYELPLLRLLYELPNGQGQVAEVCRLFEQKHRDQIPQEHHHVHKSGPVIWENHVKWCRNNLRIRGFLDKPEVGTWHLTQTGRQWLEANPHADRLPPLKRTKTRTTNRQPRSSTRNTPVVPPGINLEMLKKTKSAMPIDQFRQIWGTIYDQLLAAERAKAISDVSSAELGDRARDKLDDIHAFLNGQYSSPPRSDVVCDWIHLCYELELYREAASLWRYVQDDEVEPGYYRRAKKWAEASRVKLGW
jgi:hypothetical protein